MIFKLTFTLCLALLLIADFKPCVGSTTYTLDMGGPFDALFLDDKWEPHEGPYSEYGKIWESRGRWATQGATVTIPVFPDVTNRLSIRAGVEGGPNQRLRLILNGQHLAQFEPRPELLYEVEFGPELLHGKNWADLTIETNEPSPRSPGDFRDLRAAVDWIKVSADAPGRDYLREKLDSMGMLSGVVPDRPPTRWRFRYDPNNIGNRYRTGGRHAWDHVAYDDSGFQLVSTDHLPRMMRGDAAWYRAWLIVSKDPRVVAKKLSLPGSSFEKAGIRQVWVNGVRIEDTHVETAARKALIRGPNLIVVKLTKGPFPTVRGDELLVERPSFSARWTSNKVFIKLEQLKPKAGAGKLSARLVGPSGKLTGQFEAGADLELKEYGEHSLVVEDDRGRRQVFPVYFLGIHFFHWGWYSCGAGTVWSGFTPTSNDYIDQLLSRLDDWSVPHHSISWGGAILAPGTGFHVTKGADYLTKFREAISSGKLGFVGMPFPPRNICTDFGESLIRSIRKSLEVYESVLGYRPTCFTSHDATLTPLLPQIMRLCGYDTFCMVDNWWGQLSRPNSRDCFWKNEDGSAIRVLDSHYHGISVTAAVNRAIEQGKPAVLCHEEFACLDSTVFLEQNEWTALAKQGIFLKPITLGEYRRITEEFARKLVHTRDDGLCYKGWTGGAEGEVEYEKANRLLETHLVALENSVAFARSLGIAVDQAPIDEAWDFSMRWHECHLHWGNGYPEVTKRLVELTDWCRSQMQRLGKQIADSFSAGEGVTLFNPLGFRRSALVSLELPHGSRALESTSQPGQTYPLQPDPDRPGHYLVSVPDLPSVGFRGYRVTKTEPKHTQGVGVCIDGDCAVLDNGIVQIRVAPNGEIVSFDDARSGRNLLRNANRLFFARRHDLAPDELLSCVGNPLNLNHYARAVGKSTPRIVCSGPAMAEVECSLQVRDYPRMQIMLRVSLADGEQMCRMRLKLHFDRPTAMCPREAITPHEGTYLPGIFSAFPMPQSARPVADMAYCLTDQVLASTNHETFLNIPFRNGTFNGLSLAGPNTEEFAILTRGLPDFFVIREPDPFLALSFGMGTNDCPYNGEYVHEYALFAPAPGPSAYKAAQGFLVDAFAVPGTVDRDLSLLESSAVESIIAGVEHSDEEILVRVLNLSKRRLGTKLSGLLDLKGAQIRPEMAVVERPTLLLKPRSIREICKTVQRTKRQ